MEPDEIFLENDKEKMELFEAFVDRYLLGILDDTLNKVPFTLTQLKNMTGRELNSSLKPEGFHTSSEPEYYLNIPSEEDLLQNTVPHVKSNVHILPLSLDDNSTIMGTMSILDNLSTTFNLANESKGVEYVPFDSTTCTFDVTCARSHYELLLSKVAYNKSTKKAVLQMKSRDKAVDGNTEFEVYNEDENEDDEFLEASQATESTTLQNEKHRFETEDLAFWEAYDCVVQQHINAIRSNSDETYTLSVQNASNREKAKVRDHLNRTMLHVAVERNYASLVKYLIDLGLNVNDREGCGLTPLSHAVLQKSNNLVVLLVKCGAQYRGPIFTSIPSPVEMARTMDLTDILDVFEEESALSDEESFLIRQIDTTFNENERSSQQLSEQWDNICNRTSPGFVTPVIGDVGTCKTNSATMSRSASYRWVGLCPGDLHNKGYYCEAVFKVHGSSGFHCLLAEVLKRKGLTVAAFKKK